MFQPENQSKKYLHLFYDIDCGKIKIPKFQRDFVWGKEQTAKLIDSIIKGFPIGTFIFWKTKEELRYVKDIGNIQLPETPQGDAVFYVLDGQQRITSLYAVKKGLIISNDGKNVDYKDIYINLANDPDDEEQVVVNELIDNKSQISVYKLLNSDFTDLFEEYREHIKKIEIYRNRLTAYDFSTIVISEYPIDIACEIFTRINTGGTELTLFEIMVAKTYDQEKNFDLSREYNELISNNNEKEKDLKDAAYETIPSSTVLQCISAHLCQHVKRKDILKLNKKDFIDNWQTVKDGIFLTVDYLRTFLRIPVSTLLPYNALLIPLSYFFIRNGSHHLSSIQNKLLKQYFWWASLTNRFSSGVEAKLALDLKKMEDILYGVQPDYKNEELNLTIEHLRWRWFSTGDAFCKAILCLYAYFEPKSFASNALVKIDNSWLKVSTSKNYHHFFPRSYLRKIGIDDWQANSILNITIVDDYLNKRSINAKPPSDYMERFSKDNEELDNTMKTHLIDDLDSYGIWENHYETFIEKRGERVLEELNKILKPDIQP